MSRIRAAWGHHHPEPCARLSAPLRIPQIRPGHPLSRPACHSLRHGQRCGGSSSDPDRRGERIKVVFTDEHHRSARTAARFIVVCVSARLQAPSPKKAIVTAPVPCNCEAKATPAATGRTLATKALERITPRPHITHMVRRPKAAREALPPAEELQKAILRRGIP